MIGYLAIWGFMVFKSLGDLLVCWNVILMFMEEERIVMYDVV